MFEINSCNPATLKEKLTDDKFKPLRFGHGFHSVEIWNEASSIA